jgi:hypothetical protein
VVAVVDLFLVKQLAEQVALELLFYQYQQLAIQMCIADQMFPLQLQDQIL